MSQLELLRSGALGEQLVRNLVGGEPRTFRTDLGFRFVDLYNRRTKTAREVKTGYFGMDSETRSELENDSWLLRNEVNDVEWWFVEHPLSDRWGLSSSLADALTEAGIKTRFYWTDVARNSVETPLARKSFGLRKD